MGVQCYTSLVCSLLVLVRDLITDHDLTICFTRVVYVQRFCSEGGIYHNEKLINDLKPLSSTNNQRWRAWRITVGYGSVIVVISGLGHGH